MNGLIVQIFLKINFKFLKSFLYLICVNQKLKIMEKSTLQILEEAHHLVNISIEIRKKLLNNSAFNDEPLSQGIEDYKKISERLEKLISEEYEKVQK